MIDKAFTDDGLAPGGALLHPRSYVEFSTFIDGEAVLTGITPHHVSLHRGSHNKADEAKIRIDGTGLPFPIRWIGGAEVALYLGMAPDDAPDTDIKDQKNLRFFGIVNDFEDDRDERTQSLEAQDLSSLCRRPRYPVRKTDILDDNGTKLRTVDPTPRYSDSLRTNIERMLSILPEFSDASKEPPLRLRDTDALKNAKLTSAVNGRAASGPISLKPDSTVWSGIETVCGLLGLHVKVSLREIVVRTSDEVFAGRTQAGGGRKTAATFIFGAENGNCFGPKFHKKPVHFRNGIKVIAFDTETRKPVEAVFPDDSEVRRTLVRKRPAGTRAPSSQKPKAAKPKVMPPPARDVYELDPGHYTKDALLGKAKAIWLERSRQECDGTVATPIWTEEILGLQNGDLIAVKIADDIKREIDRLGSDDDASQFLQDRLDFDKSAADAIVRAARKQSNDDWYCKEVTIEHPSEHLATVHFLNLLEI